MLSRWCFLSLCLLIALHADLNPPLRPIKDSLLYLILSFLSLPQGERSFFLQPGEHLESGIQDVYVLSEEEGLVLRAVEAFNDSEQVRE